MTISSPIIHGIMTEKASAAQGKGRYTFMVKKEATKIDIKKAVKDMYGMDAKEVKIMISPRKTRLLKNKYDWVKRPTFKKAIVSLKGDKTIDPNKIKEHKEKEHKDKK